MKRIVLFILIFSFFESYIYAQLNDATNNHIIVSVAHDELTNADMRDLLRYINGSLVNNKIMRKGDHLSMTRCSFDIENSKLTTNFKEVCSRTPVEKCDELNRLSKFGYAGGNYRNVVSVAKAFSLNAFKSESPLSNRLFLIFVSDRNYVGNDFFEEMQNASKMDRIKNIDITDALSLCDKVQQNYFCRLIKIENYSKCNSKVYIHYYEYVPIQQYFSVESVVSHPTQIVAQRQKNGYCIDLQLNEFSNPNFLPIKAKGCLVRKSNGKSICVDSVEVLFQEKNAKIEFMFAGNNIPEKVEGYTVEIRYWIQFKDGVVDNIVLHPTGGELQGRKGLNNIINVTLEKEAYVLWLFPLSDFMYKICFWTSSQYYAAAFWSISIIILIVVGIVYMIKRLGEDEKPQTKF